ncbi:MAG TPA: MFS transporter [Nitriliruptoraceae bacterium]|nr:MFS transporter [Nitriliruptoraceae bacterium]
MPGPIPTSPRLGLLSAIRLAGNGAFRFLYPFLPVVAAELGVGDAWAGVLVGALAVGGMASPVVRGWLVGASERPRRLLVLSAAVVTLGTLGVAAAPLAAVAVAALLVMGAGKPLLDAAAISYVSARTTFATRARATSTMELTWAGALVIIAPLAGLVAAATSWRVALAVIALSVALLAVVAHRSLDSDPVEPADLDIGDQATRPGFGRSSGTAGTVRRPRRGIRATLGGLSPTARDYLLVVAFAFGALEATFSVFGLWLDRVHGVPLAQLGGFAAIVALGELTGAGLVTLAADRIGKARTLWIGLGVCAAGLAALALTTTLSFGIAALAVGLVGSETAIVAAIAIASEVQPEARSRYLAVMFSVTSLTRAVVGGIGPAIFAATGIAGNVAVSVAAAAIAAVLLRRAVIRTPALAT